MISNYPVRKQTNKQKNWIKYTHTHTKKTTVIREQAEG